MRSNLDTGYSDNTRAEDTARGIVPNSPGKFNLEPVTVRLPPVASGSKELDTYYSRFYDKNGERIPGTKEPMLVGSETGKAV